MWVGWKDLWVFGVDSSWRGSEWRWKIAGQFCSEASPFFGVVGFAGFMVCQDMEENDEYGTDSRIQ